MKLKQNKKISSAYTMAEMIMTITILAIIAGIASPMMTASKHRTDLAGEAALLENLIKTAQTMTITGEQSYEAGGVPTYGFGINFSSTNDILIYANIYDEDKYQYEAGSDIEIVGKTIDTYMTIKDPMFFDRFEDSIGTDIPSNFGANIVFLPPDGEIELSDNRGITENSFDNEMSIFLKHPDDDMCYKFTINKVTGRLFKTNVDCTL